MRLYPYESVIKFFKELLKTVKVIDPLPAGAAAKDPQAVLDISRRRIKLSGRYRADIRLVFFIPE